METLIFGILAHVDAGKTTLSEAILYLSGKIRTLGRVDKKDTYLDTDGLEKERGITIFSKQAIFEQDGTKITLLDTPGHIDFSAEMERTLQVLDYAILVINGADGIQGHTRTLWGLLKLYKIPTFLFINKMDQTGVSKDNLIAQLKADLSDGCIDFKENGRDEFYDQLAMCDEMLMDAYLEKGTIDLEQITKAIKCRKIFPCFFGSALKLEGVEEFIRGLKTYTESPTYPQDFGAKIFKITRDEQGNRLTHMKVTGGKLKVKDALGDGKWEEKINQIRLYSGTKFEAVNEIEAGTICAVTGLSQTKPGEGIGIETTSQRPILEPVLSYKIILPDGYDPKLMLPKLRGIEEEQPELYIVWDEELQEIQAKIMGEIQIETLQSIIKERFNIEVTFGSGSIIYKETITNLVEGVGHFEPLRHYAEVHLLMEPAKRGSGLQFELDCSEDLLSKAYQRLVLSHLEEKEHKGVLTGSSITDMKITLVSGRAHNKHTVGGDFREATYRAVRQGVKQAKTILLEPYYNFILELPEKVVGRAMTDIERMNGTCEVSKIKDDIVTLVGEAPVVNMRNYHQEVLAYTKGYGRLTCTLKGYEPCHNTEEIIQTIGYDSERDVANPTGSVFCKHGVGFLVEWDKVEDYMHLESYLKPEKEILPPDRDLNSKIVEEKWLGLEEIEQLLGHTMSANQGKKVTWKKGQSARDISYRFSSYTHFGTSKERESSEEYLLVDGYNIIFAWEDLNHIAQENMDGARIQLLEALSNYQGLRGCKIIAVFDAYRVQGHQEEVSQYQNITVVFTKEAQTADHYIERFVHSHHTKYRITVATSDALEQIIIRGKGASLLSARELQEEIKTANQRALKAYEASQSLERNYFTDSLSLEAKKQIEDMVKDN